MTVELSEFRGYIREGYLKKSYDIVYSYMKYTNEPSAKTAISWGCHLVDEFADEVNEITKVFMITKAEWKALK